jgi:AbrB family looped-hinge helix DNA binding protein
MAAKSRVEVLKVGRRGQLVLPRHVLNALALRAGDELVLSLEDDQLVLRRKARRFAEYLDTLTPSAVDSNGD